MEDAGKTKPADMQTRPGRIAQKRNGNMIRAQEERFTLLVF
jgi:hypothetical protein